LQRAIGDNDQAFPFQSIRHLPQEHPAQLGCRQFRLSFVLPLMANCHQLIYAPRSRFYLVASGQLETCD
jgi:hypothetical protein